MIDTLRIPKRSGTHADTLYAVGVADLLADVFPAERVRLRDVGDAFLIEAPPPILPALRAGLPARAGFRYIAEKGESAPLGVPVCHYEQERERSQRYRDQAQALRKEGKTNAEIREQLQQDRPGPEWRRERSVRLLQGHVAANKVIRQIAERGGGLGEVVAAGFERLARGERSTVNWRADQVQVFNPPAAKGYARLKPDSTDRNDGSSDAWADPLIEWLRMRGYYRIATPFHTGGKGEHIRVLTPVPADITVTALQAVADGLQLAGITGAAPKMDALAALALARLLVERCAENRDAEAPSLPGLSLQGRRPSSVISSIQITHYQSLGQSRAVGSLQVVAVPGWFAILSPADVRDWLNILGEHRAAVLSLDDQHSDEIGILLAYRQFLQNAGEQGGEAVAEAFLDFLGQYGCFYVRAREQNRRVRQFLTVNVRRVLVGIDHRYTAILDDPGFIAVADAVRRCTVSAQAQRAMNRPRGREIRYDLLPELRRKRSVPDDEFVETVAEFVSQYNGENARRREMGLQSPRNITTDEFHAFVTLIEAHGACTVGALLCAYGTCRKPREGGPEASEGQSDDIADAPEEAEP